MRYIYIKELKPGMVVAKSIMDDDGRVLVGTQAVMTESYIEKLESHGIYGVYINDELSEGIEIEEVISQQMRLKGAECVKNSDIEGCMRWAKDIVKELLKKEKLSFDMSDLRTYDNYTFSHSVNVAVYVCVIGMGLNFQQKELEYLVTAGLLHDLGKKMIPEEIINKPGRLTKEEYDIVKTHSTLSYEILKDRWDISSKVKEAVLSHHENEDGSGYPSGMFGERISLLAKILHVADVYDALVTKRSYKDPYSPFEAAEYLMGACGVLFDKRAVNALLKYVPLYPKGSPVILSDGRKGIIFENSGEHNLRPIIRLMDKTEIDLTDMRYMSITLKSEIENESMMEAEEERKFMDGTRVRQRILLVDDMKTNLMMLREILESRYDLSLAKSGEQAVAFVENNICPDLVIMDIDMPGMNGIEAATKIQELSSNAIPILFVTSMCDKETVLKCKKINAAGYIIKPYKATYIRSEVKRILEN